VCELLAHLPSFDGLRMAFGLVKISDACAESRVHYVLIVDCHGVGPLAMTKSGVIE
jgi:hypothetical protein